MIFTLIRTSNKIRITKILTWATLNSVGLVWPTERRLPTSDLKQPCLLQRLLKYLGADFHSLFDSQVAITLMTYRSYALEINGSSLISYCFRILKSYRLIFRFFFKTVSS